MLRARIVGCGRIGSEFDDDPKRKTEASKASQPQRREDDNTKFGHMEFSIR